MQTKTVLKNEKVDDIPIELTEIVDIRWEVKIGNHLAAAPFHNLKDSEDYFEWCLKNPDVVEDFKAAIEWAIKFLKEYKPEVLK